MEEEPASPAHEADPLARLLSLLAAPEFRDRPYGIAADLEALVEQNRDAWDE